MGLVRVNIEIINAIDTGIADRGLLARDKIRSLTTTALVDSGAYMLCINETIANQLGLKIIDEEEAILADGSHQRLKIAGPVEIRFGNRRTHQDRNDTTRKCRSAAWNNSHGGYGCYY